MYMDIEEELKALKENSSQLITILDMVAKIPNDKELGKNIRRFVLEDIQKNKSTSQMDLFEKTQDTNYHISHQYIYESPDGGKTVYQRKFGESRDSRRKLHKTDGQTPNWKDE